MKGRADAPVLIEVFVDLTSDLSYAALDAVDELLASDPAKYRVRFRNLANGEESRSVHALAMAAAAQGAFWPAVHVLASSRGIPADELAARLNLDGVRLHRDLKGGEHRSVFDEDAISATRAGIRGAPAVLVSGKRFDGLMSAEQLRREGEQK